MTTTYVGDSRDAALACSRPNPVTAMAKGSCSC